MLKHILTSECPRTCGYCIAKNVKQKQVFHIRNIIGLYVKYRNMGHTEIMLTGGEPSRAVMFRFYIAMARQIFDRVFITTQAPFLIQHPYYDDQFDAITFSIHDAIVPEVKNNATVYASILDARYNEDLVSELVAKGYKGLTINENHRGTAVFDESVLPVVEGFSIRINRRGKCLDEPMIMPDLTTIENFKEYL